MLAKSLRKEMWPTSEVDGSETGAGGDDRGFTLIELMVVLLIMAVLLAIAIPTFLGTTKGAEDRQAQTNLTNALTASKAIYVQNAAYTASATFKSKLAGQEPELQYTTGKSTAPTLISVWTNTATSSGAGQLLELAIYAKSTSMCWVVRDIETSAATTGTGHLTPGDHYGGAQIAAATCTASKIGKTKTNMALTAYKSSYPNAPTGH